MRERACSIVIRGGKVLFVEQMVNGELRHVFIGGGVEAGETPREAALRELYEEANVQGKIVFGPAKLTSEMPVYAFIVTIADNAVPVLGYDPELPPDRQDITRLVWKDTQKETNAFNSIDKKYFSAIIDEAEKQGIDEDWVNALKSIIIHTPAL